MVAITYKVGIMVNTCNMPNMLPCVPRHRLAHAQAKFNRHREKWFLQRDQLEEESGPSALTCDCKEITYTNAAGVQVKALACTPGSPYRLYTGDLRGSLKTFVCEQVRFHSSELLAYDVTHKPLPPTEPGKKYATRPHASAHRVCHHRECKRCGIGNSSVFSGVPVVKLPGGGSMRACSCEANDTPLDYSDFQLCLLDTGSAEADPDGPLCESHPKTPKAVERWMPVPGGTRATFITYAQATMIEYCKMQWHWDHDEHVSKRMKEEALIKPALLRAGLLPAIDCAMPKTAVVNIDFAASMTINNMANLNSVLPQCLNSLNSFFQFDGELLSLEGRSGRQANTLRKVHGSGYRVVRSTNVFVYNYCGASHDTNYCRDSTGMNLEIIKTGLNPNSRVAVFDAYTKTVVPWKNGTPSWFKIPVGFTMRGVEPYTTHGIDKLVTSFDGAVDFASRHNLHAMQNHQQELGVEGVFRRFPAACGKGVCDGGSTATKVLVESAVSRGNRSGGGGAFDNTTEGCATFVATLLAQGRAAHEARGNHLGLPKENEFTVVLVSYAPDDGSAFGDWKVDKGFKGSASKYFYESVPPPSTASEDLVPTSTLRVRDVMCVCFHCMRGKYHLCSAPWQAPAAAGARSSTWRNARSVVRILPRTTAGLRILRNNLAQFVGKLTKGVRVAARVNKADVNGEEYFLAIVAEKPFKVAADGTFGTANPFRRGEYAVRITWLYFLGDDEHGNRKHEAHGKDAPLVFPVDGLVHTACPHLMPKMLKNVRGMYTLGAEQHEQILLYSQL